MKEQQIKNQEHENKMHEKLQFLKEEKVELTEKNEEFQKNLGEEYQFKVKAEQLESKVIQGN